MSPGKYSTDLRADLTIFDLPVTVAAHFASDEDTIFTINTGNASLGSVIRYLVDLAKPGLEIDFGKPWDIIDTINLGAITFQLNASTKDFGFRYDDLGIKLPFIDLDSIGVWSRSPGGEKRPSVDVQLYGSFFGISFQDQPLTWDALEERPPAVPAAGAGVFDLQYLGLGQHVTLRDIDQLNSVGQITDALNSSYVKVDDDQINPLTSVPALTYSDSAGWLAGIQFSVLDTFDLAAVWNLPTLAGMRIGLRGEKAKSLAGLEFEVLYRQIAANLGLYSIELQLPDGMRHFQSGAAALTLPIIDVDIYTNGTFKIDLGYPVNFDFSRSFSLEMMIGPFPASGALGAYFGALDEQAVEGLPQIVSGSFAPVIVAGLGVRLGLGKSLEIGVLKADFFLGIEGLLEGVVAFYQPRLASEAGGLFYRVGGALQLTGHIYGRIDFKIVKVEVDIYASVGSAFTMESYRQTIVLFRASVHAAMRIKINVGPFKITIAFSFTAQIQEQLAIGSNQAPPWRLVSGEHPANASIHRMDYRCLPNGTYVLNRAFAEIVNQRPLRPRLVHSNRLAAVDKTPLVLYFNSFITMGFAGDRPDAAVKTGSNSQHFGAGAPREVKLVAGFLVRTSPKEGEPLSPFAAFGKAALQWALAEVGTLQQAVGFAAEPDYVSQSALQFLADDLKAADPRIPIDMDSLEDFLEEYIELQIEPNSADELDPVKHQYAPFPMLPYMQLTTSDGYQVNFRDKSPCSLKYQRKISEYFAQLAAQDSDGAATEHQDAESLYDKPISMAELLFVDTFKMILRHVIGAAIEAMELFSYPAADGQSLPQIAAAVGLDGDDAMSQIAAVNLDNEQLLHPGTELYIVAAAQQITTRHPSLQDLARELHLPLLQVAKGVRQQTDLLDHGAAAPIRVVGGRYLLQPGDTPTLLEKKFQTSWQMITTANSDFDWTPPPGLDLPAGETIRLPTVNYQPSEKDSLQAIADLFSVSLAQLIAAAKQPILLQPEAIAQLGLRVLVQQDDSIESVLDRYALPLQKFLLWAKDEANVLAVGTKMTLAAGGRYIIKRGDTLQSISTAFRLSIDQLLEANPDIVWQPWAHSRQMLPNGKVIQLPALSITVAPGETLQQLANRTGFNDIATMIAAEIATPKLLAGLARLTLPPFQVAIKDGQSISQVANQYGLDACKLLLNNQILPPKPPTWNNDDDYGLRVVQIPDCERLPQELFYQHLETGAEKPFDATAPMLGRFLFHGLRLPNPEKYQVSPVVEEDDTDHAPRRTLSDWANTNLYPLYELTGQQWPAPPDPKNYTITIGLTDQDRLNWAGQQIRVQPAAALNAIDARTITLHDREIELIEAFRKLPEEKYFDPGTISLTSYPAYQIVSKVYGCQPPLHWAAPTAPNFLPPPSRDAGLSGQESPAYTNVRIYPLGDGLRQVLGDHQRDTLHLQAMAGRIDPGSGRIGKTAIANSGWATQCDIRIRQVYAPGNSRNVQAGSYEIFAGDGQSIADFLSVIRYLRLDNMTDQVELHLLYRTDPASDMPEGVRSDTLAGEDANRVAVIKSNLSTFTTAPDAKLLATAKAVEEHKLIASASLLQPLEFLSLLWECSVVNGGGFYLWYGLGDGERVGLPDYLFQDSDEETLSVLILIRPKDSNHTILAQPFHNALVVAENLAADNPTVTIESARHTIVAGETLDTIAESYSIDSGSRLAEINATLPNLLHPGQDIESKELPRKYTILPGDTVYTISCALQVDVPRVAAAVPGKAEFLEAGTPLFIEENWIYPQNKIPPGLAGFRLLRKDPERLETGPGILLGALAEDDVQERLELLFHLIGFRLEDKGGFKRSTEGLPIGPQTPPADSGDRLAVAAGEPQPLDYQRLMKLAPFARNTAAHPDVDGTNPYAGLGGQAEIALQYHDIFGNKLLSDEQLPKAPFNNLYRDDIIGFRAWPAADLAYDLAGTVDQVSLTAILSFNGDGYLPGADQAQAAIVDKVHGDLARYRTIFFQTLQPDMRIELRCSFKPGAAESGSREHYNKFALDAFKYLKTVQDLHQITIPVKEQATLCEIGREYCIAVEDLAVANGRDNQLIAPGVRYQVPEFAVVLPGETVAELAARGSFSVEQIGTCNVSAQLTQGLDVDLGGYGTYRIEAGDTLAQLACFEGAPQPDEIAAGNQSLALFAQDGNVLIGLALQQTEQHDSFAAMAERAGVDIKVLAKFNHEQPIWQGDAVIVIPSHQKVGQYAGMTITIQEDESLADIAKRYNLDPAGIASVNLNIVDVLQLGQTVYYPQADQPDQKFTIRENETLFTLTAAMRQACANPHISPVQLALYNRNLNNKDLFLGRGQLLRPPQPVPLTTTISSEPKTVMTDLEVTMSIKRSKYIDPEFAQVEAVCCYKQDLRPSLLPDDNQAGRELSLVNFARRFETAFPNLRLAKGKKLFRTNGLSAADDQSPSSDLRLIGVHIDSDILHYRVLPEPYFFASTPLEREPWSAKNVSITPYQGDDEVVQSFNNIDLNDWGARFLGQMDDLLGDALATAVYSLNPELHNRLAAAKAKIARAIADRVEPIFKPDQQSQYDPGSARERYYEHLLSSLSVAYQHSTIVQFPVQVSAPPDWGGEIAPRLVGRVVVSPYRLPAEAASLRQIGDHLTAPVEAVALQSADAANLLAVGNNITYQQQNVTIRAEDTLQTVADYFGLSMEQMARHFGDDTRLLKPRAPVDLVATHYVFRGSDTLRSALGYLVRQEEILRDESHILKVFALMNSQVKNIFNTGFVLQYDCTTYTVQDGDTLESIANALGVDLPGLLRTYIAEPGLVRLQLQVSFLRRIPTASFAAAKIDLTNTDTPEPAVYLNTIFSTSTNFDLPSANLPLRFEVQSLEYNIKNVSFHQSDGDSGYQASDYLSFIIPLPESNLGRVSIPIVKRNLPPAPVILGQTTRKSYEQPEQVKDLTLYDYVLSYRYESLPCDDLEIAIERNIRGNNVRNRVRGQLRNVDDLAFNLAQYSTILEPLAADINLLRNATSGQVSGEVKARATYALTTFTDLAERIAASWSSWRQSERPVRDQRFRINRHCGAERDFTLSIEALQDRIPAQTAALEQIELKPLGCASSNKNYPGTASVTPGCYTATDESTGTTYDFFVKNISVIDCKNIWAKLTVVRNRLLDDQQETNPAFLLQVPDIRAIEPAVPLLMYSLPLNAPRSRGRFDQRFSEFMRHLLDSHQGQKPQCCISLTASFVWTLAGEGQSENRFWSRDEKNAAVTTIVPVVTSSMSTIEDDPFPEPFDFSKNLYQFLDQWIKDNTLPHTHCWSVTVRLYSDLGDGATTDQLPLMELQDVRIPVADTGGFEKPEEGAGNDS